MERIRLNKSEKEVLRLLNNGCGCPETYSRNVFVSCVDKLEMKGLAKGAWSEGHKLEDARITLKGKAYISENPNLRNPVDWAMIATLIAAFSALVSLIALFIACSHRINI